MFSDLDTAFPINKKERIHQTPLGVDVFGLFDRSRDGCNVVCEVIPEL